MSERQKQAQFLRALIGYAETGERCDLLERIKRAERDERCVRVALELVGLLAMAALFGLGYSIIFIDVEQIVSPSPPVLIRLLYALGLGSLFCLVAFGSSWFWYRRISDRIHDECRSFIMKVLDAQAAQNQAPVIPSIVEKSSIHLYENRTVSLEEAEPLLRKAS